MPQLDPPATYFPLSRGSYEVAAGLRPLGTDFGNAAMDRRVFQIDAAWHRARASKVACRAEDGDRYVARADLDDATLAAAVEGFAGRLVAEYPDRFDRLGEVLACDLTGDRIDLAGDPWAAFDGLAMQVAEDVCLVRVDAHGRDWLAAGHVCSPSHWSIDRKIGLPFTAVHAAVPGIDAVNRSAGMFVRLMVDRGPFVRFAWGFATDDRLNHHPDPPAGADASAWRGRRFDPADPRLFLRVERQVTWGLPAEGAAAFTIRVSHVDGDAIRADPERRHLLASALQSMSAAALAYKGLAGSVDDVLQWLGG